MLIIYNVDDVELPYHVKFPYPVYLKELLHNLVPGLPCPVKITYTLKASWHKFSYFFETNDNQLQKFSSQNYF